MHDSALKRAISKLWKKVLIFRTSAISQMTKQFTDWRIVSLKYGSRLAKKGSRGEQKRAARDLILQFLF